MNRRGIFFTIMALLLVAFLITYQRIEKTPAFVSSSDTTVSATRVAVMDNYISTFETYAAQSLASSGYVALQNLSGRVRTQHKYLTDMNASITFCLNNLTTDTNCLSATQTFNASLQQLITLAKTNLSITTTYSIQRVWITEERPFEVVLWMNISYNVSDPFATWVIENRTIRAPVEVTGIEDPAFAYANSSNITRIRYFSPTGLRRSQFNNNTFTQFYYNESYLPNPGINPPGDFKFGPSVLQRYTGQLLNGSACCGIESVMRVSYTNYTVVYSNPVVNWSFVDYEFLSRENIPPFDCSQRENARFTYSSFPDWVLRLDTYHFYNVYNVSAYLNYTCAKV